MGNAEMTEFWNGRSADLWVAEAERFDTMLAPVARRILDAAELTAGERVLDVGCGNGALSLDAALAVGQDGTTTGIDLSEPMLRIAQRRSERRGLGVDFLAGDAQSATFAEPFDVVVSRFGVMFFDDPVLAFSNLARATRDGGRLSFACWQEMFANEWLAVPATALLAHVGIPDLPAPGAPGPFSLADADHTTELLHSAGWSDVAVQPHIDPVLVGRDPGDVIEFMLSDEMGRRMTDGKDPDAVEAGAEAAREALRAFVTPDGVVLSGAYYIVTASKSSGPS